MSVDIEIASGPVELEVDPRAGTDADVSDVDWGDDDHHAHYTDKEGLVEAMMNGWHIIALCGHTFIPMRDPQKFPVCQKCQAIHDSLPDGGDE